MPSNPPEAAEGGQQFEWSETVHAWLFRARIYLKRYWWIFFLTVSGGVGWQAYKEYNRAPSYQSNAEMEVELQTTLPQGVGAAQTYAGSYATNIAKLGKADLIQKARDEVMSQRDDFRTANPTPTVSVAVQQIESTAFLSLTAQGNNQEFTTLFLEQLMESFLTNNEEHLKNRVAQQINLDDTQANNIKEIINADRAKISKFLEDNNLNKTTVEDVEKSAGDAAGKDVETKAQLENLKRSLAGIDLDRYVDGVADKNGNVIYEPYVDEVDRDVSKLGDRVQISPEYLQDKQELLHLDAVRDSYSKDLQDIHPKMMALKAQIDSAEYKLKVLRRQIRTSVEAAGNSLDNEIAQINATLAADQKTAHTYAQLLDTYTGFTANLASDQDTYNQLVQSSKTLELSSNLNMDTFSISQHASPASAQSPNKPRELAQGAFVGLVLGTGLIFLLGAMDGRVMSVEDLTQRVDETMLGIIPMQKHVSGQVELLKSNDQRLMFAESCRHIRSSLLYMDKQGQRPQIIVITSSIPSEGKSTISANLAITLGFAASRTLLVDADLRRGQLHKRFGLKNDVGLTEHILNGVPIENVIRPTGSENLEFISCGHYPAQPGELLMSARFNETLKVLRQRYDFVVFDSPPVLATDDAVSFATRTDAVIFVVRAGYTRLRQIRTSLESLHRRSVNLYGMVVNFIDHREPSHYSYKYYDYYSYRPPETATKPPFKSATRDPFKDLSSGGLK